MRTCSIVLFCLSVLVAGCGPSEEENQEIAATSDRLDEEVQENTTTTDRSDPAIYHFATTTCNDMRRLLRDRNGNPVEALNNARKEIGKELFRGDRGDIFFSLQFKICEELVLNNRGYFEVTSELRSFLGSNSPEFFQILEEKRAKEKEIALYYMGEIGRITESYQEEIVKLQSQVDEDFYETKIESKIDEFELLIFDAITKSQLEQDSVSEQYSAELSRLHAERETEKERILSKLK